MKGLIQNIYFRTGLLLALCVGVAGFCFFLPNAGVSNQQGVVLNLPEEVPGFHSELVEMSEKEREWLPGSTKYLKRQYYPKGYDKERVAPVSMSLIVSGGDERSLHRPEVCMDGQGWQIPTKRVRKVEMDGKQIDVMDLYLKREVEGGVVEAHYYFFWVGMGISTAQYREMKLYSLWDNFTKNLNHRWAYPAVMVHVNPQIKDRHEKAWLQAEYFIKHALPSFHKEFGAEE